MNGTDKFFYIAGWLLLAGFVLLAVLQGTGTLLLTDVGYPCSFRAITGYYCPGCGGTRAICSLAAGDLISCAREHAFVLYTAAGTVIYLIWNSIYLLYYKFFYNKDAADNRTGRTFPAMHFRMCYIYIGIGIFMLQWIVKNIWLIIHTA